MPETDGTSIVFVQAGWLHVLDTATNKVRRVNVEMPSDRWELADRTINPRDYIHAMTVSNDGKTAVFEARGDIYLAAVDDSRPPRNLTHTPGSRERFPQLSPDGKRVAFYRDKSGDYQVYTRTLPGEKPWEQLTTDARSLRLPPRVVARRLEDPVRQQGLLAVLPGRRDEEADEDSPRRTR